MKNLQLKALEVQEMTINEMKQQDGGNWWMMFRVGNNLWGLDLPFESPSKIYGTPGNYYTKVITVTQP